ncbi:integrin alpha-5 [Calliopsis andreniformis]|uniref:integrin alpha-5 n=1 Tax=Calliopsis andreniformis TaxID=337506 RepID=UPI003FCD19A7
MYSSQLLSKKFNVCFLNFVLLILRHDVLTYNLDVDNVKVFSIPKTSNYKGNYFGFSVALYTNGEDSILLVGAPRANSSATEHIIEPGTVYQCPINGTCKEWIIDDIESTRNTQKPSINEVRDHAWIGATIAIENKTDAKVVICGPRWKNSIFHQNRNNWYMNGICYWTIVKNAKSFNEKTVHKMLPFIGLPQIAPSNGVGVYNFGMAQTGFSLHITSNELKRDIILGSPGIYNWKGLSLLYTDLFDDRTQIIIPSFKSESRIRDNDYFGYAVTSGCYFEKGELWFVSGAPRGANMYGYIIIHKFPTENNTALIIKNILSGGQHGEYFGAALASCDLNGDGKDELIVGAPQWTKDMDEGRIYIFTISHNEIFEKQVIEGDISGSKFGFTITCLGDIDYDGFPDIAVGAPYEKQTGAIYIFNGNSNGIIKHYSQKIIGKQLGENIRGFGISISEPRDINGDKYPDIAVGAYLSEQTILIKSRPVVIISTRLTYMEKKKLLRNSTSFGIEVCTSYHGIYVPENLQMVAFLTIDEMHGRAFYGVKDNNDYIYKFNGTLQTSEPLCIPFQIRLKENIQNVIDPLEISVSIALGKDPPSKNDEETSNLFCRSCAVINKFLSKTNDLITLPFAVECGEDNICVSDVKITLSTDLKSDNRYVIGSKSTLKFIIDAFNYGEPAYQAKIYVYIPEILSLASIPHSCIESSRINDTLEVICNIENPLRKNKTLALELDMSEVRFDSRSVKLCTNFTTQSEEKNSSHMLQNLTIYFDTDADITIAGKARDDLYEIKKNEEKQLSSLQFQHMYEVQKFGASAVEEVTLEVSIPSHLKHSTGVIEIISINQTSGHMDGQQFYCTPSNFTPQTVLINKPKQSSTHSELSTQEKYSAEANYSVNLPPENRTVYINCSNTNVKCTHIKCLLGPFISSSSVAKLSITLDIYLSNFKSNMIEGKDIIFVVSNGSVNIVQPNITQKLGHKPDTAIIATMFLGSPVNERLATWIIVLSVVVGIILLILLVLGLIKMGFFNRKKKEELEALKSKTNKENLFTLETNSSREVLD